MKKNQIIASLREELDVMRQRAESAERKLFGEPVWVDADDEEIDFGCRYCLAKDIDTKMIPVASGTPVDIEHPIFIDSRKIGFVFYVETNNSCKADRVACVFEAAIPSFLDSWAGLRFSLPIRKIKNEVIKEG